MLFAYRTPRVVTWVCLLSMLLSTFSTAVPAPIVSAAAPPVESAPARPLPALIPMTPPVPSNTGSTGLPASAITTLRNQYDSRHRVYSPLELEFPENRVQTGSMAPITVVWGATTSNVYTIPASTERDSIEFDVSITTFYYGGGTATIHVRPKGSSTWNEYAELMSAPWSGGGWETTSRSGLRFTLGTMVPTNVDLELQVTCNGYVVSCSWSNIKTYDDIPAWTMSRSWVQGWVDPTGAYGYNSVVRNSAYEGITPINGRYLSMDVWGTCCVANGQQVAWDSPLLQLPNFTSSETMTLNVDWVRKVTDTYWGTGEGFAAAFVPVDTQVETALVSMPISSTTTLTWTTATSNRIPDSLSGKVGRVRLIVPRGLGTHILGIDNLRFELNGADIPYQLPTDATAGWCPCEVGSLNQAHAGVGVNTFSGSFATQASDISVPTDGPPLSFSRTYVSQFADPSNYPTTPLGPGWRHSFGHALTLPSQTGGITRTVIYEAPSGNRLRFLDDGLATSILTPEPGIRASLVRASGVYTLTLRNDATLTFDSQGRLTTRTDSVGHTQTFSYANSPGNPEHDQLETVTDVGSSETLSFDYATVAGAARLSSVSDSHGRSIDFTYDSTTADLETVTDLRNGTTTYTYNGSTHLLTGITDPNNVTQLTNTYDTGVVTRPILTQTDGLGITTSFTRVSSTQGLTTTITRSLSSVTLESWEDHYRSDRTFEYRVQDGLIQGYQTFDGSLTASTIVDGNGNATLVENNRFGQPLSVTDATGRTTEAHYLQHRLNEVIDPLGVKATWEYDTPGKVITSTVGITTSQPLGWTSRYTYTADLRYTGDSLVEEQRNPQGIRTRYAYNSQGQVISTTVGFGTSLAQTTGYGYDALGRVVTTTLGLGTSFERDEVTVYNDDNTVAQTIQNYQNGSFDPAYPDQDIVTTYGYDGLGRSIWFQNVAGQYDVTRYNAAGQVEATARNVTSLSFDSLGQPIIASFSVSTPDQNVATLYGYDGLGRTTLVTETGILTGTFNVSTLAFSSATTRTTRTEYDELSRPVTVTLNYRPGLPATADTNVQTLTYYDGAGNVIWQRDGFGRWTKTEYDELNRPVRTIQNYEDGDPLTNPTPDVDLVSETVYDAGGRVERTIENAVNGIFTPTEPITDRVTLYEYDALSRPVTTTLNLASGQSDTALNRVSVTAYDLTTGRVQGSRDALGRWVSQQYDALGRATATTQNCRDLLGQPVATGCATFNPSSPDMNVTGQSHYDALGRVAATTDPAGIVRASGFDGLGRVTASIQNYIASGPTTPITNVTTLTSYNGLGQMVATTDPTSAVTTLAYDGLGHTSVITDAANRVTRQGYDATSAMRWSRSPDGRVTVFQVDGLGRTVATIQNYEDGTVTGADGNDRDLITRSVVDAGGRQIQTIDANGRVTGFDYDNRDLLVQVTENVVSGTCTNSPCNVVTQYQYDRAGNRTAIIDANSNVRRFVYDAANQMIEAKDGLNQITGYAYDAASRLTTTDDPRGAANDLIYGYDGLDRPNSISATNLGTITQQYDALGRRTSLIDGTGTTSFDYDPLGRITEVVAPNTGAVGYGYNARGQRTSLTYPGGPTIEYTYLADGQLDQVLQSSSLLTDYDYDSVGRLDSVTRANGAVTNYGYDDADRLRDLTTVVSGTTVADFEYTVDRIGLRTDLTETLGTTSAGLLADIKSSGGSAASAAVTFNGKLYFTADDGINGVELWASDGTSVGTVMLKDIEAGAGGSAPAQLTVANGKLFFVAYTSAYGSELWTSDGTSAGTILVQDSTSGSSSSIILSLTAANNRVFYSAFTSASGFELWTSDGTNAGTGLVTEIRSGSASSSPTGFIYYQGKVYFAATDGTSGAELWASDGTASGTVLVKDIRSGSSNSNPETFAIVGSTLFFRANDGVNGLELWKTDGTTSGTTLVKDIIAGSGGSSPISLTAVGAQLFFSVWTSTSGQELWVSDGAATGTVMVSDIRAGSNGSSPALLTAVGSKLFFRADDGTNGAELWVSDGSTSGTTLVKDIISGGGNPGLANLTAVGNSLFFSAWTSAAGQELWVSDGTNAGTQLAADIQSGTGNSTPTQLRVSAGRLFLVADDGVHGNEPWLYSPVPSRTITYTYDGFYRLTGAVETGATNNTHTYSYDNAGNRTGVWLNGTRTITHTHNAANQVNGWSYDAAGNFLSDGTNTYTYDPLGRVTSLNGATNAYNGDGVLVAQTVLTTTTHYTQDLASPLSQILGDGTAQYVYGYERLFGLNGSTRTWYTGDALGSLRTTLSDSGSVLSTANYDPWGVPQGSSIAPFGFTGELQQGGSVYMRARWYQTQAGTFTSRDPFEGFSQQPYSLMPYQSFRWQTRARADRTPYSLHPYAYALSNPVLLTDPTGFCSLEGDDYCFPNTSPGTSASTSLQGAAAVGGLTLLGSGTEAAALCAATVVCIATAVVVVGGAYEIYYFTMDPNAAGHREDLVRGATYVWSGIQRGAEACGQVVEQAFGSQAGSAAPIQAQNERKALGTVAAHLSKLFGRVSFGGFPQFEPPDDDPNKERFRKEIENQSYQPTTANSWLGDITKALETIAQRNPKLTLEKIMLQNRLTPAQVEEMLEGLRRAEYTARSLQGRGVSDATVQQLQAVMQRLGVTPWAW